MVLGRSADHRGTADVDVLDRGRIIASGRTNGFERVEVDDREVDALDAVLAHRSLVFLVVTDRKKAAMHARMQGLYPAIHDFGKARNLGHVYDRQARRRNRLVGAAGRQELDAERVQRLRKLDDAALVGHRQERGADPDAVRHGNFLGNDGHGFLRSDCAFDGDRRRDAAAYHSPPREETFSLRNYA